MKKLNLHIFVFIFILTFAALAEAEIAVWQVSQNSPRILIPMKDGESPRKAVERYRAGFYADPQLRELLMNSSELPPVTGRISKFSERAPTTKTLVAINANWASDMHPDGTRIKRNVELFNSANADTYVIALAYDAGNTERLSEAFRQEISQSVDLLVSLGGNDIAPEIFGDELTYSQNFNARRDQSEFKMLQTFRRAERGVTFSICRGHQLTGAVDGHHRHQDLVLEGIVPADRHSSTSSSDQQRWHHIDIAPNTLLSRILRTDQLLVNSTHHQALKLNPNNLGSFPVAEHEGVIEAMELRNGLGLSVQFHPEFPSDVSLNPQFSERGFQLIRGMVAYSRLTRARHSANAKCQAVFH